jgi:hypothetical protein
LAKESAVNVIVSAIDLAKKSVYLKNEVAVSLRRVAAAKFFECERVLLA